MSNFNSPSISTGSGKKKEPKTTKKKVKKPDVDKGVIADNITSITGPCGPCGFGC